LATLFEVDFAKSGEKHFFVVEMAKMDKFGRNFGGTKKIIFSLAEISVGNTFCNFLGLISRNLGEKNNF